MHNVVLNITLEKKIVNLQILLFESFLTKDKLILFQHFIYFLFSIEFSILNFNLSHITLNLVYVLSFVLFILPFKKT